MTTEIENKIIAAIKDTTGAEEVTRASHDHYGLPVFETDTGEEYAVAVDEFEAMGATDKNIRESLWAFNSSFIANFIGHPEAEKGLRALQEKLCEDANEIIFLLVQADIDGFVEQAIDTDGRGVFLSQYDGKEVELGDRMLAYRIN